MQSGEAQVIHPGGRDEGDTETPVVKHSLVGALIQQNPLVLALDGEPQNIEGVCESETKHLCGPYVTYEQADSKPSPGSGIDPVRSQRKAAEEA